MHKKNIFIRIILVIIICFSDVTQMFAGMRWLAPPSSAESFDKQSIFPHQHKPHVVSAMESPIRENRQLTMEEKGAIKWRYQEFEDDIMQQTKKSWLGTSIVEYLEGCFIGQHKKIDAIIEYIEVLRSITNQDIINFDEYQQLDQLYIWILIMADMEKLMIRIENGALDEHGIEILLQERSSPEYWKESYDNCDESLAETIACLTKKSIDDTKNIYAESVYDIPLIDFVRSIQWAVSNKEDRIREILDNPKIRILRYIHFAFTNQSTPAALTLWSALKYQVNHVDHNVIRQELLRLFPSEQNKFTDVFCLKIFKDFKACYKILRDAIEYDQKYLMQYTKEIFVDTVDIIAHEDFRRTYEALYYMLKNKEWRSMFEELWYFNEAASKDLRAAYDLQIFLSAWKKFPEPGIPFSALARDWKENFEIVVAQTQGPKEMLLNYERRGRMLEWYAKQYHASMDEFPRAQHQQILQAIVQKNQAFIDKETDKCRSSLNEFKKAEISRISYIRSVFDVLWDHTFTQTHNPDRTLPALKTAFSLTTAEIQGIMIKEINSIMFNNNITTPTERDRTHALKRILKSINNQLPMMEKFNQAIDLRIIPDYAELIDLTPQEWSDIIGYYNTHADNNLATLHKSPELKRLSLITAISN